MRRERGAHDDWGRPEVGQVVLPAPPDGSPATREWQVNVSLTRNNDLPYGSWLPPILSQTREGISAVVPVEPHGPVDTLPDMAVQSHQVGVQTRGNNHVVNITDRVADCIGSGRISNGTTTVFVIGSTAGVTTTEFEPGLANHDLETAFEGIAPRDARYLHEETWHDDNGHAHVRASLLGPSLTVPVIDRQLQLGTWQQIVLIDFDTRARQRKLIVQVVGE